MKIDTTKIPGFDALTEEQKNAISGMSFPDEPNMKDYVKKDLLDKATHEAAEWKKKHNELLAGDNAMKIQNDQEIENMKNQIAELKKNEQISGYTAKYLAQGYTEDLAQSTAKALADGDMEKVFENQKKFTDSYAEQVKKGLLESTPRPPEGNPGEHGTDYAKLAENARLSGDYARQAAYIRISQQKQEKKE